MICFSASLRNLNEFYMNVKILKLFLNTTNQQYWLIILEYNIGK